MSLEEGRAAGYFFPAVDSSSSSSDAGGMMSLFSDPHLWDIFHVIDFSTISWTAVIESMGTVIALAAFRYVDNTSQTPLIRL